MRTRLRIVIPLLGIVKGGGLRVLCELSNGLAKRGHLVILAIPPFSGEIPFFLTPEVKVIRRRRSYADVCMLGKVLNFIFLARVCKRFSDIVISNYYLTFYIGFFSQKFYRKKNVYFIQGLESIFFLRDKGQLRRFKRLLARLSYRLPSTKRITISQYLKDQISRGDDIVIIHDGIDPKIFHVKPPNDKKEKLVVCTIALTEERKGFPDFIKAIRLLVEQKLDFEVLLFSNRLDLSLDLDFPFKIIHPKDDDEVAACYNQADIFVSASYTEGFGLPGLEAMACGCSLVTTDSGGVNEYALDRYNSIIVPTGAYDRIAEAIRLLLDNADLRRNLSRNGIETVKRFTWDVMCEDFENELLSVV